VPSTEVLFLETTLASKNSLKMHMHVQMTSAM
jgi:hypothetical protein